ncbi:hypothetical protein I7I48_00846 [Histoplasma ohiense]|nr:hypothetical protein I7I48_00846 [Histoplasma ohiense (nom. inval.)]
MRSPTHTSQLCNYGRGEACTVISGVLSLGLKQETQYYSIVSKYDSSSRTCWVNYYICPPATRLCLRLRQKASSFNESVINGRGYQIDNAFFGMKSK